jgi:hypothetical protein
MIIEDIKSLNPFAISILILILALLFLIFLDDMIKIKFRK